MRASTLLLMSEELFRFVAVRPPQSRPRSEKPRTVVTAYPERPSELALGWKRAGRDAAVAEANRFVLSDKLPKDLADVSAPLSRLDDWLLSRRRPTRAELAQEIERLFGSSEGATKAVGDPAEKLADALLAVALTSQRPRPRSQHLTRGLQLVALVCRATDASVPDDHVIGALDARVVLPSLFDARRTPTAPDAPRARVVEPPEASRVAEDLYQDLRRLRATYAARPAAVIADQPVTLRGPDAVRNTAALRGTMRTVRNLTSGDLSELSESTRAVFRKKQIVGETGDLATGIEALERELETIWGSGSGAGPVVVGPPPPAPPPTSGSSGGTSGTSGSGTSGSAGPSVPKTTGTVRSAGIGDLLLVRQRLVRYELGEISHIENVLAKEHFERVFRRKDTTELFEEEEIERTETTERELQTTTKSELKTETEKTLEENLKFEAGVNLSYNGPMIEIGANAGFSYERATTESTKTASTFARDVVDRSVSKLQERVLKKRSQRIQREVEDTSTRGIANDQAEPVVGVYRWVDKINECEIVNYGRRELVEFVVPEPAALYRHLLSNKPARGVTAIKPEEPKVGSRMLRPSDITEYSYKTWLAKYNVTGITPPPAVRQYIGIALEMPKREGSDSASKVLESGTLKVPAGYTATKIDFDYAGEYDSDDNYWEVVVGTTEFKATVPSNARPLRLTDNVPVSLVAKNWGAFTANIVIECSCSTAKLEEWQITTFNAIMNKYERLRSEYDEQVEAQRVQAGNAGAMGTNPLTARDLERAEVKRAAIMMLTGQAFELFGSIRAATDGGPSLIDFADADLEGDYIQFIEQAFEWRHMTYAFYPYFWGRKSAWQEYALADDVDPTFAQFLRAGAARVVVAVRPGFGEAVKFFLKEGRPWSGGAPPIIEDDDDSATAPYVTIAQELSEQLGLDVVVGEGKMHIEHDGRIAVGVGVSFDATIVEREIVVDTKHYRVLAVRDDGTLELDRAFTSETGDYPYGIGPRRVGIPWEVRLPTTLVLLDGKRELLPDIPTPS